MAGNKGAVGIRLEYHDTSFCFVTAHLAAGHSNVEERNMDYRTITNGLHFLRGKTIDSHQCVIFCLLHSMQIYRTIGMSFGSRTLTTASTWRMRECGLWLLVMTTMLF